MERKAVNWDSTTRGLTVSESKGPGLFGSLLCSRSEENPLFLILLMLKRWRVSRFEILVAIAKKHKGHYFHVYPIGKGLRVLVADPQSAVVVTL